MTLVELKAGVQIDLATGDELNAGLGSIKGMLEKGDVKPIFLPFTGSRLGAGVIELGSPPTGRLWNILSLTLVGADDSTLIATTFAALYVDSDPSALGLAQCRIPRQAIPSFQAISDETLWAHASGSVCINVTGTLLATDQVVATITVAEWRENDVTDSLAMR